MSRVVAGTLLLPNGQPMANASIYFTAKRTEPVSIIEGSNTFFNTNGAGVYNQTVVNGFYAVSIEYIADSSGAHTRRWPLGDVFIEDGAASTLEALIIASNQPSDLPLTLFYEILADAQQAAADAQAAADSAAASAASINIGTAPTNVPNNTILNNRLGTTGNLGTLAQQNANAAVITGGTLGGISSMGVNGDLIFSGSARKLFADFSSSTFSDRAAFQTSVPNATTGITSAPNGSGSAASWISVNSSDLNNCAFGSLSCNSGSVDVVSGVRGTGAPLPMYLYCAGTAVAVLATNGNMGVGVTSPASHKLEVSGRAYAAGGFVFPSFTVATVPSAAANTNAGIVVVDSVSGRRPFWSNGTNWRDAANVILS